MKPFLTCSSPPHRLHRSPIVPLRRPYHRRRIWVIYAHLKPCREQRVRPGSVGTNTGPVSFPVGGRAEGNWAMAEVVVITGSSAGVGRATARAFGARGAWVGLLARGRDGL